jgi:ABC-2 type transport system ATP-binding protein
MHLIQAKNIIKKYRGHTALDNISIDVERGSVFGLLGPNGAGKTTLIRIINQIIAADEGHIIFDGDRLEPKHISQIGYMPEERGLYKNMKVGEQAIYLARLKGMPRSEAQKRLRYWFEKFEITSWWDKRIDELSKGMAQKVQFIVTVLHEPKLLIFDEPFSGFDPVNAEIIKDEILELKDKGATILFSTHRMESVEEMCDHICLIDNSHKVLDGKISEVKRSHRDNQYEITINDGDFVKLESLNDKFDILKSQFNRNFHDQVDVTLKKKSNTSAQELLNSLMTIGELHRFTERIPSINEIFIKHVDRSE